MNTGDLVIYEYPTNRGYILHGLIGFVKQLDFFVFVGQRTQVRVITLIPPVDSRLKQGDEVNCFKARLRVLSQDSYNLEVIKVLYEL